MRQLRYVEDDENNDMCDTYLYAQASTLLTELDQKRN